MGKSENGAVWVRSQMLNPFDYFQYFRNVDDRDVVKFLNLYTDIDIKRIQDELANLKANDINIAKEILAFEATKICHGEEIANECLKKAKAFFEDKNTNNISDEFKVANGTKLIEVLVLLGFCKSNSDAKKLISQGAVLIDNIKINDISYTISTNDNQKIIVVGKKKFIKLIIF